jgi:hypothetical protein
MQSNQIARLKQKALRLKTSQPTMEVYHDGQGFSVIENNELHKVKPAWIDAELRNATMPQLLALKKNGYVTVSKMSNGDLALRSHLKLKGGGPILGPIFYVATKGILWGGVCLTTAFGIKQAVKMSGDLGNRATNETSAQLINAGMRAELCTGDVSFIAAGTTKFLEESLTDRQRGDAAAAIIATTAPNIAAGGIGGIAVWIESVSMTAYKIGLAIPWW